MGFNDPQVIKNIAFGNRVADLKADEINAPVIGWTFNGGANQQWTLEPEHGKEYKISTTAAGNVIYVSSKDPAAGDNLTVGGESSVYTVQEYNGFYHISIHAEDGTVLYWTLSNAANGTKISLKPANNTVNQLWALNPAS